LGGGGGGGEGTEGLVSLFGTLKLKVTIPKKDLVLVKLVSL
jgi:hypothetical protein